MGSANAYIARSHVPRLRYRPVIPDSVLRDSRDRMEHYLPPPLDLVAVHGQVGKSNQTVQIGAVFRINADADAGGQTSLQIIHVDSLR